MLRLKFQNFWHHNGGSTVVEYALLIALIGAGLAYALSSLGAANNDVLVHSKETMKVGTWGSTNSVGGASGASKAGSGTSAGKGGIGGSQVNLGGGSTEQGESANPAKKPESPELPNGKQIENKLGRNRPS